MNGTEDFFSFLSMIVYIGISVSWSESLCQDREKEMQLRCFSYAYPVITINTSIKIV